ncbi:MAG: outer membrane beta-barrel protein [Chthoniobacteraceae bacterium]
MPRTHRHILATTLVAGGCALILSKTLAQELPPTEEPLPILSDFSILGESLLIAPATEIEQLDAAEAMSGELGPGATIDDIPAGRWKVTPHLESRVTYDDNIFIQPRDRVEDFIFTLSPGLAIGIWDAEERRTDGFLDRQDSATVIDKGRASFFVMDYTAIVIGFAKTDSQNAFDQDARLDGQWQAERWSLGGGVHYESKSETNTDIGTRIRRETITAEMSASYRISGKTAVDASATFRANDPETYVRTTGLKVEAFASYEVTPLVRFGLGGAVGGVEVEGGSDDNFEQILARAIYGFSEKLDFEVRGGVEFRQSDGAAGDRTNPIFSVVVNYKPSEGTRIGLAAYRSVETSEFRPEESYERTGITATFRRAVRPGIHIQLDGGYQESDYTGLASEASRRDRYFFIRSGLLYNFADWGNVKLTYEFRRNDSSHSASSFDNNQAIFQVNITY